MDPNGQIIIILLSICFVAAIATVLGCKYLVVFARYSNLYRRKDSTVAEPGSAA